MEHTEAMHIAAELIEKSIDQECLAEYEADSQEDAQRIYEWVHILADRLHDATMIRKAYAEFEGVKYGYNYRIRLYWPLPLIEDNE